MKLLFLLLKIRLPVFFLLMLISTSYLEAQRIEISNEKGKRIYTLKEGRNIDFRIDHKKLYPESSGDILETRMYSIVDSIVGNKMYLSENQIIINFTKTETLLVEMPYEYTELTINLGDIKGMSFTPIGASIGNSLFMIGIATILASPLLGITPDGYSTQRVVTVAGIGAATTVLGGSMKLVFGQKPVKFKDFDGPDYFKKYQKGSISIAQ